ncbi:MAG: sodium-independent anion transporter, partial [Actinobacteria bacterium]|nr:sodium-independent anion transporter [Actinomycetota bacterium]
MLVPQGMAYALLAGLPPEIGLYASTLPLLAYALFGTSRQLAVGPVAIVSLLTASALAPLYEQGTTGYISAAALLALLVGLIHLVLGFGRLGFVVNFLSHSVLVGFTAAAAIIIGFSQVKHLLGVSIPRTDHFHETVAELVSALGDTHGPTLAIGAASVALLLVLKRVARRVPGALVVVITT